MTLYLATGRLLSKIGENCDRQTIPRLDVAAHQCNCDLGRAVASHGPSFLLQSSPSTPPARSVHGGGFFWAPPGHAEELTATDQSALGRPGLGVGLCSAFRPGLGVGRALLSFCRRQVQGVQSRVQCFRVGCVSAVQHGARRTASPSRPPPSSLRYHQPTETHNLSSLPQRRRTPKKQPRMRPS
jgi:hypothetical protein